MLTAPTIDETTKIALATPHEKRTPAHLKSLRHFLSIQPTAELAATQKKVTNLKSQLSQRESQKPTVMVMQEMPKPRPAYILETWRV